MATLRQFITEVIIRDKTKEGATSAQGSFAKLSQAAQGTAQALGSLDRIQTNARGAFDKLSRSLDPAIRAQAAYKQGLEQVRRAQEQGVATDREAARMKQLLTQRLKEQSAAQQQVQKSTVNLSGAYGALRGALAGVAGAMSVRNIVQTADAYQALVNKLNIAVGATGSVKDTFEALYATAQKTRAPIEGVVTLFQRVSLSAKELGASQEQVARLTEVVGNAMQVAGTSGAAASGALLQLSQLLGGAVVQATEFNSLIDGLPTVLQAVANGIEEAGGSVSKLRDIMKEGKLTNVDFFNALLSQDKALAELASKALPTVGQAMTVLGNAWEHFIGQLAQDSGFTAALVSQIDEIQALFQDPEIIKAAQAFLIGIAEAAKAAVEAFKFLIDNIDLVRAAVGALIAINVAQWVSGLVVGVAALAALTGPIGLITVALVGLTGALGVMALFDDGAANSKKAVDALAKATSGYEAVLLSAKTSTADLTVEMQKQADAAAALAVSQAEQSLKKLEQLKGQLEFFKDPYPGFSSITSALGLGEVDTAGFDRAIANVDKQMETIRGHISELRDLKAEAGTAVEEAFESEMTSLGERLNALTVVADLNDDPFIKVQEQFNQSAASFFESVDAQLKPRDFDLELWINPKIQFGNSGDLNNVDWGSQFGGGDLAGATSGMGAEIDALLGGIKAPLANLPKAIAGAGKDAMKAFDNLKKGFQERIAELDLVLAGDEARIPVLKAERDALEALGVSQEKMTAAQRKQVQVIKDLAKAEQDRIKAAAKAAAIKDIDKEIDENNRMAAALLVSREQADLLATTLEVQQRIGDAADGEAMARAQSLEASRKQVDAATKIADETERARDQALLTQEAPWRNLIDNVNSLWNNFWDDFADRGWDAITGLGDAFHELWNQLQADLLKQIFEPIRASITGAIQGVGQSGGFNIMSLFGGGGGGGLSGAAGATVYAGIGSPGFIDPVTGQPSGGGSGFSLGNLFGGGSGGSGIFDQIGEWLGIGTETMGQLVQGAGLGSLGGMLSDLLGLGSGDWVSDVGSAIGGAIGNVILPGIGGIIGGFLGSALGGLFKQEPSNYAAGVWLDPQGNVLEVEGTKATEATLGAAKAAGEAAGAGLKFLIEELDATLGRTIQFISVGTRDLPEYGLTGDTVGTRAGSSPEDIEGVVNAALKAVLAEATFADPVLDAVADALAGTGRSFDDIAETLAKLKNILGETGPELSKWGEALKEIHDTIDPLIEELGSAAGALEDALERAIAALRVKFADDIDRQILAIEAPLALDFRDLIEAQSMRISDATELGADPALMAQVTKLNRLEFERFLEAAKQNVGQLKDVREQITALIAEAQRLGQPLSEIVSTMQAALDGIVNTFNTDITRQLATLTNPTKAALIDLLEQQRERTRQAVELGANTIAVERLNALERQKFFENLSEEQKLQLGDVLGLIEDYGGAIGVVLAQVNDAFSSQIDTMEETRAAVEKMRDTWQNFADAVKSTREGIVDRYGPGSPLAKLDDLRARFATLRTDALAGNESAQAALPQVAQQIIDRSRELFGTTQSFFADYNTITQALAEIEAAANGRVTDAQTEIDRLTTQVDLLTEIRNVLQSPDPSLDYLEQQIGQIDQTNVLLRELLTTYVDLTRQQLAQNTGLVEGLAGADLSGLLGPATPGAGSSINLAQLIAQQAGQQAAQAVNAVLTQPGAIGNPAPAANTNTPGGSVGGSPAGGFRRNSSGVTVPVSALQTSVVSPSAAPGVPTAQQGQGTDLNAVVIALTQQTQATQQGLGALAERVDVLGRELRNQRVANNASGTRRTVAVP